MCSSICREFGLAGDWRNQANQGRLAVVPALEQIVEAAAMRVRQWFGQGVVDAPVSTGDRLGTRPLDGVEGGQNDRLPPQVPDQGAGQHDAFVGLHRQLGQHLDGLPVMAHGEGPETEHGLQLAQVLAPGLLPLAVLVPAFDADLELVGDRPASTRAGTVVHRRPRMTPGKRR